MSNHLPPGTIPKLFRLKNKNGKEVGNWRVNIDKKPVNLRTQDYFKARERAREAVETGKREFPDERNEQRALPPMRNDLPQTPKNGIAGDDWTVDLSAAVNAAPPEPEKPAIKADAVLPPPPRIETKATDVNAEFGAAKATPDDDGDSTEIDPEMLEELADQCAAGLVELQLLLQEWLAKRTLKIQMGQIPEQHKARRVPAKIWKKWLKSLVPQDLPIPPYLAAPLVAIAMTIPVQLETATAIQNTEPDIKPKTA